MPNAKEVKANREATENPEPTPLGHYLDTQEFEKVDKLLADRIQGLDPIFGALLLLLVLMKKGIVKVGELESAAAYVARRVKEEISKPQLVDASGQVAASSNTIIRPKVVVRKGK